jgi:uncharacterized protein YecE (DUF72 family)
MERVRIGCSGWSYGDWRGGLYPEGLPQRRWLERYAEVFDTVEVNATFYRLPKRSIVESWVEQVPGDFLFAVKASRYLTHMKRLHEIADAVARFWEPLEPLRRGRRLGPVLWQLPETFHRDDDLRLHYGHRGRGGNYSEAELDGWRRRIAAWRSRRPVFVYLNNDWKGYAPTNARYLKRGLSVGGEG